MSKPALRRWISGISAVLFLGVALYFGAAVYIATQGLELHPAEAVALARQVPLFVQNDAKWGAEKLGDSTYTLAQQGCAVTDVAMVLAAAHLESDPASLNANLTKNQAYTSNGNLIWSQLEELYPVDYRFKRIFSAATLVEDLKAGVFPIVKVKYGEQGLEHWVLVVGADKQDFLIMDPLSSRKVLASLAEYGRIYAYRALVLKK